MDTITLNYTSGLGAFLDENFIDFYNEGNNQITVFVPNAQYVADLLMNFITWRDKNGI